MQGIFFCLAASIFSVHGEARQHYAFSARGGLVRQAEGELGGKAVKLAKYTFKFGRRRQQHQPEILHVGFPKTLHIGSKYDYNFLMRSWKYPQQQKSWNNYVQGGWKIDPLTDARVMELATQYSPRAKELLQTGVKFGVEKSDIGRLLAVAYEGGVYMDDDVTTKLPPRVWPRVFHQKQTGYNIVLGVEFPYHVSFSETSADGKPKPEGLELPFQLTNWAMAAMPGNPVLVNVVERIFERAWKMPDKRVVDVIPRTGPAALTAVLLEVIKENGLSIPPLSEFRGGNGHIFDLKEKDGSSAKLLILPRRAFGYNGAAEDMEDHLVEHAFAGSWKDADLQAETERTQAHKMDLVD